MTEPGLVADRRVAAARHYDAWFDAAWGAHTWRVEAAAVLDVGCGTGRLSALLADGGADTVGVDLDAGILAVAAHRAPATWFAVTPPSCPSPTPAST